MTNYKQGDVFRWSWNEYEYNQRENGATNQEILLAVQ